MEPGLKELTFGLRCNHTGGQVFKPFPALKEPEYDKEYYCDFSDIEARTLAHMMIENPCKDIPLFAVNHLEDLDIDLYFIVYDLSSELFGMQYDIMRDLKEMCNEILQ